MSYFYAEVKRIEGSNKQKLVGLHDTSAWGLPDCTWGGDLCRPITEFEYKLLSASRGKIKDIIKAGKFLDEWLEGED